MDKESEILERLRGMRAGDPKFEDGKILSSVSTKPLGIAIEAFKIFADTNALDTHIFSKVEELEKECIGWIGNLLHNRLARGYITTGGTEANIFALWVMRENSKKRQIIVPRSAHYSVERAANLLGLEIIPAALDENFKADAGDIERNINENTLGIVLTAGTSALGAVDPVEDVSDLISNSGEKIFLHVDAAFGGFIIPFLKPGIMFDFELENVTSMTIDPHKMGMAPIPSGAVLLKNDSLLDKITISPPYLPFKTNTLSGTRSGGAIAATYATLNYIGVDGYEKIVGGCMENTKLLCSELSKLDCVEKAAEPELNIVGIMVSGSDNSEIVKKLGKRGWKVSLNEKPKCIRVVVMPHTSRENILCFIDDLRECTG